MIDRRTVILALAASGIPASAAMGRRALGRYIMPRDQRQLLDAVTALDAGPRILPYVSTPGDGLGRLFNQAQIERGALGRDFGCRSAEATLSAPRKSWIVDGRSPRLIAAAGDAGALKHLAIVGRYVSIGAQVKTPVRIGDCLIQARTGGVESGPPNAIACTPGDARLDVSDCTVSGGYQAIIGLQRPGSVRRCYVAGTRGDGFNLRGAKGRKILDGNLVHRLGQDNPQAHADCVQFNPADDSEDFWITRNTFYMPGDGSFSEAVNGPTCVINGSTQGGARPVGGRPTRIARIVLAGNLLVGGGFTISWMPRPGGAIENIVSCNNLYAPSAYRAFHLPDDQLFYPGARDKTLPPGRISNLIFHNEKLTDGRPVSHRGRQLDGIWHYDRDRLLSDPVTLELAQKFGLVDADGHLRTGVEDKRPFLTG